MPRRDWRLRVEDILEANGRVESYTHDLTFEDFCNDSKTVDAVVRNLEVIGEAAATSMRIKGRGIKGFMPI